MHSHRVTLRLEAVNPSDLEALRKLVFAAIVTSDRYQVRHDVCRNGLDVVEVVPRPVSPSFVPLLAEVIPAA